MRTRSRMASSPLGWASALCVCVCLAPVWTAAPASRGDEGDDDPAKGFGAPGEDPALDSDLDAEQIKKAIGKGLDWLRKQQNADGSFKSQYATMYPVGPTALATLTMLKCGVDRNDKQVLAAFDYLRKQPLGQTSRMYGICLLVLAIEARYAPPPEILEKSGEEYATVARKIFKKMGRADKQWLEKLVAWIVSNQASHAWRYPGPPMAGQDQDLSCTQYALLALKAASRLGVRVPSDSFKKALEYLLVEQAESGPEVDFFPIPAADGPIATIKERSSRGRSSSSKRRLGAPKEETVEREQPEGSEAGERPKMFARGWSYLPRKIGADGGTGTGQGGGQQPGGGQGGIPIPGGGQIPIPGGGQGGGMPLGGGGQGAFHMVTGSMTAAGIAGLVICKSELESERSFWKRVQGKTDQAIRDGCAWLAANFSVRTNPPGGNHHYYYLYGLERAGVLAGTYDFGKHDWYDEGGKYLLDQQKADGSWVESLGGGIGGFPMPGGQGQGGGQGGMGGGMVGGADANSDTCFALLFLKRATVPIVDIPPKRVITSGYKKD